MFLSVALHVFVSYKFSRKKNIYEDGQKLLIHLIPYWYYWHIQSKCWTISSQKDSNLKYITAIYRALRNCKLKSIYYKSDAEKFDIKVNMLKKPSLRNTERHSFHKLHFYSTPSSADNKSSTNGLSFDLNNVTLLVCSGFCNVSEFLRPVVKC